MLSFAPKGLGADELEVLRGELKVRTLGHPFQIAQEGDIKHLPKGYIVYSAFDATAKLSIPEGSLRLKQEYLLKQDLDGRWSFNLGQFEFDLTHSFSFKCPSVDIQLTPGQYSLSIMEGLGALTCLKGSAKLENAKHILDLTHGEKAIFNTDMRLEAVPVKP